VYVFWGHLHLRRNANFDGDVHRDVDRNLNCNVHVDLGRQRCVSLVV
jgi:hypothetical protein